MTRNGGKNHRAGSVAVLLGCLLQWCIVVAAETDLTGKQTHARNIKGNDNNWHLLPLTYLSIRRWVALRVQATPMFLLLTCDKTTLFNVTGPRVFFCSFCLLAKKTTHATPILLLRISVDSLACVCGVKNCTLTKSAHRLRHGLSTD